MHQRKQEPLIHRDHHRQLTVQPKIHKRERENQKQIIPSSVLTNRLANSDSLYTVTLNSTINITTTVTSSSAVVSSWISSILSSPTEIVGLDVEWRPSFVSNQQHPVSLLQLCVGNTCLVFQLLHCDSIPSSLIAFLKNPRFTFLGVGVNADVRKLVADYGLKIGSTRDLRYLAMEKMERNEVKQMGIKKLTSEVLGIEVNKPKRITMSRWDQRFLNLDQIGYAAVDAFLSFEIGRKLFAMCSSRTTSTC